MLKSLLLFASLAFVSTQASAQKATLKVGDAAPAIQVKQWVKGEAVKAFAKDQLYVVEFWATWCPPCRESIPHLTELQKKHKDVQFIGVSVFEHESDQAKVAPFVEKMGEKMVYHVAMDDVPEGKKNNEGAMAKSWMLASGSGGIPTAFIVDKATASPNGLTMRAVVNQPRSPPLVFDVSVDSAFATSSNFAPPLIFFISASAFSLVGTRMWRA